MKKNLLQNIFFVITVLVLLIWSVGPIFVGLSTSLSTQLDINHTPSPLWPAKPNWQYYEILLSPNSHEINGVSISAEVNSFSQAMKNSLFATGLTVLAVLFFSVPAGYAFNRLRFKGKKVIFYMIISTLVLPGFALLAPLFRILSNLKIMDTFAGLVLVYVSVLAPLAIWLFYNYTGDLPVEPEESALVDGCTKLQSFWYVVLPQMVPGIAALTAIVVLSVWGQFLLPLLFAPTLNTKPVTVLITEFIGKYNTNVPLISAAGILAIIPPALVVLFLNRYIRGMLSGWGK
jgi:multiple sugar transport system permease protein